VFDDLLPIYERELSAIRALAAEFADAHPKIARRLQLGPDHCDDPDVERLFQSFAWMAARIGRRLDAELPELAEPLVERLCPLLNRPVPSATILQLERDPRQAPAGRYRVPRQALALSPPVAGVRCAFRTTAPVDLWPVAVAGARFEPEDPDGSGAALVLDLATPDGLAFRDLGLDRLRLFLDGPPARAELLLEQLGPGLRGIRVEGAALPPRCLRRGGFDPDEALFGPVPAPHDGLRLLFEGLVFPGKFRFLDLSGLDRGVLARAGDRLRIRFLLGRPGGAALRLLEDLGPDAFRLDCVPAVNLHAQDGAPVAVDGLLAQAPVRLAGRAADGCEVVAVERARLVRDGGSRTAEPVPAWPAAPAESAGPAWRLEREPSAHREAPATDATLSLVDPRGRPAAVPPATLELQLTCSDGGRPRELPWSAAGAEPFLLPRHSLVAGARARLRPTPALPAPAGAGRSWPILAHLFLNTAGLAGLDRDGLQGLLDGLAPAGTGAPGLLEVATGPATALLEGHGPPRFARGTEGAVTLDPARPGGPGPLLLAALMEGWLAQACPGASFVRVRVRSGPGAAWLERPPRAGAGPPA
jgi:type VI secretion system protein ImpG